MISSHFSSTFLVPEPDDLSDVGEMDALSSFCPESIHFMKWGNHNLGYVTQCRGYSSGGLRSSGGSKGGQVGMGG